MTNYYKCSMLEGGNTSKEHKKSVLRETTSCLFN